MTTNFEILTVINCSNEVGDICHVSCKEVSQPIVDGILRPQLVPMVFTLATGGEHGLLLTYSKKLI